MGSSQAPIRSHTTRVLLLSLTGVLLASALAAALPSASGATSNPSPGAPAALSSLPFAERAGFDPTISSAVVAAHVAVGAVTVVVTFAPSDPAQFFSPAPGAPALTVAQIGDRFGLSPSAYAAAEAYFEATGLRVAHSGTDRLSLSVTGPADRVGAAFGTQLLTGMYEGRVVTFPSTAPAMPLGLESEISGVTGLSSGFDRFTLPLTPLTPSADLTPHQGPADLVTPGIARLVYQASSLYNVSGASQYATGQKIVLLLWGDGYAPSDISTFYATHYPSTFPAITWTPYPIDGAPAPSPGAVNDPSGAPEELTLDLEWAGSMAPGASLDAVYAPDGPASNNYSPTDASMADALNTAVTGIQGVTVISMSFGTADSTAAGLKAAWATDIAEATMQRITLLAATGDNGGDTAVNPACSGTPQPDYPSSDVHVIAVGGTDPTLARSGLGTVTGIASEPAWSDSGGGFGSEAAPSWQTSTVPQIAATGLRGMPDVAAAASTDYVYFKGSDQTGGGTSFATPLWGGLIAEMDALHGTPLGEISPRLYTIGSGEQNGKIGSPGIVDVTSGSNCLGNAGPGWDTATGWGSPRALLLYEELTATFVQLSISAAPLPVGPGASLTISAHLANSTSGAPLAGVPIQVTLTADTSVGPCGGTFGSGSPSTNGTGDVSVVLSVPSCYLGSKAVASVQVTANGYFGSNQTIVGVNLLGYLTFLGPAAIYPTNIVVFVVIIGSASGVGYILGSGPRPQRGRRPAPVRRAQPAPRTAAVDPPPSPPSGAEWKPSPAASEPDPRPVWGPPPPDPAMPEPEESAGSPPEDDSSAETP